MSIVLKIEDRTVCAYDGDAQIGKIGVPEILLHWADGQYIRLAGIGGVGTHETHRGQGIAGRMMEAAKTFTREQGYAVSGLTTNLGNNARRLYARAGYATVFRPGRFEKALHPVNPSDLHGVDLRPYREGDEEAFIRLFEMHHRSCFGFRAKTPESWRTARAQYLSEEPDAFLVAEAEGEILGWTGIFHKWVGLCSEVWTVPDRGCSAIAQALLAHLGRHHLSRGRAEMHIWASPQDRFTAGLLAREGYAFREMRVFMLHIIDLPGLLRELLPLFQFRLSESTWRGALALATPEHRALLRVGDEIAVDADGAANAELQTDAPTLCRLLTGGIDPYEAYQEALISVRPGYTPECHALLKRLFPPLMHLHPADDLW